MSLDLNRLRKTLIIAQDKGESFPSNPKQQVVVTKEGEVRVGNDNGVNGQPVTEVEQSTFA